MRGLWRCLLALIAVASVVGFTPVSAAAPPANDEEAGAVEIGVLPYSDLADTSEATASGPRFCTNQASVFYTFTPQSSVRVQVDLIGSEYDTTLAVYTRGADGKAVPVACNDDRFGVASGLRFRVRAGTTYVIQVGRCCGSTRDAGPGGGPLALNAAVVEDIDLEYSFDVSATGSVDPETGIATLSGLVSCNERSIVFREGMLRQLRQGLFVARGSWGVGVVCTPDSPVEWSFDVDTDSGIAFGPGRALVRMFWGYATDGWHDYVSVDQPPDVTITLE
jgi:hypothetical protein